jgi:hypothetical protein
MAEKPKGEYKRRRWYKKKKKRIPQWESPSFSRLRIRKGISRWRKQETEKRFAELEQKLGEIKQKMVLQVPPDVEAQLIDEALLRGISYTEKPISEIDIEQVNAIRGAFGDVAADAILDSLEKLSKKGIHFISPEAIFVAHLAGKYGGGDLLLGELNKAGVPRADAQITIANILIKMKLRNITPL